MRHMTRLDLQIPLSHTAKSPELIDEKLTRIRKRKRRKENIRNTLPCTTLYPSRLMLKKKKNQSFPLLRIRASPRIAILYPKS